LRPLSYKETVRGWSKALVRKYTAKDQASLDKAHREFEEYEIDIVNVIGKMANNASFASISTLLQNNTTETEAVNLFFPQDPAT